MCPPCLSQTWWGVTDAGGMALHCLFPQTPCPSNTRGTKLPRGLGPQDKSEIWDLGSKMWDFTDKSCNLMIKYIPVLHQRWAQHTLHVTVPSAHAHACKHTQKAFLWPVSRYIVSTAASAILLKNPSYTTYPSCAKYPAGALAHSQLPQLHSGYNGLHGPSQPPSPLPLPPQPPVPTSWPPTVSSHLRCPHSPQAPWLACRSYPSKFSVCPSYCLGLGLHRAHSFASSRFCPNIRPPFLWPPYSKLQATLQTPLTHGHSISLSIE